MNAPIQRSQPEIVAALRDMRTPLAIAAADRIEDLTKALSGVRAALATISELGDVRADEAGMIARRALEMSLEDRK